MSRPCFSSRRLRAALLATLLFPSGAGAAFSGEDMLSMMQGMRTMMQMWNMYNALSNSARGSGPAGLAGLAGLPSQAWPGADAMGAIPVPPFARDPRGGRGGPPPEARLAGVWQGSGGEVFLVRGDWFRLQGPAGGVVQGRFLVHGPRMVVYLPDQDQVRLYEFEQRAGAFVLKDAYGQITLFQRQGRAGARPQGRY